MCWQQSFYFCKVTVCTIFVKYADWTQNTACTAEQLLQQKVWEILQKRCWSENRPGLYLESNTQKIIYSSEGWLFSISYHRVTTLLVNPCAYLFLTALVRFRLPQSHIGCNKDTSSSAINNHSLSETFKRPIQTVNRDRWRMKQNCLQTIRRLPSKLQPQQSGNDQNNQEVSGSICATFSNQSPVSQGVDLFLGVTNWRSLGPCDCNLILLHTTGFSVSSITQQITSNSF